MLFRSTLAEETLDTAAARVVSLVGKTVAGADTAPYDADAHHALAREAAAASIVLLRNEDGLLPLDPQTSVAVVGELARTPRFQGAGSSLINPTRVDSALAEISALTGRDVGFAPGYDNDGSATPEQTAHAVAVASSADVVLLFLGVPAEQESEGFDRDDIELPSAQLELLDAVLEANPRTVVVLSNGGVVRLSGFADRVPAIVEGWLLGQAGGGAVADVLYGITNPSGRLTETIPLRLEDSPAFLDFGGEHGHARYGEGIFVGYRWYDARDLAVSYPFGHGLSYTTFAYSGASATASADGAVTVAVTVTNTGTRAGAEVVQVYTTLPGSAIKRAPRVLAGFTKVVLAAGESRTVDVRIARTDLAYWETRIGGWIVEGGDYTFSVGSSSRDLRASVSLAVDGDPVVLPLTHESTVGEMLDHPTTGPLIRPVLMNESGEGLLLDGTVFKLMATFPIGRLATFPGMPVTAEQIDQLIAASHA